MNFFVRGAFYPFRVRGAGRGRDQSEIMEEAIFFYFFFDSVTINNTLSFRAELEKFSSHYLHRVNACDFF